MKTTNEHISIISPVANNQKLLRMSRVQVRSLTIVAALSIIVIYQCGLLIDADALTRYFNCTTRSANKNGTLSLENADNCYDFIFKGAKVAEEELQTLKKGVATN